MFIRNKALLCLLWTSCFLISNALSENPSYTVQDYSKALNSGSVSGGARPDTVDGEGAERVAEISTSLGVTRARWSRSAEKFFGNGMQTAVQSAWTAAARALSQNSFPTRLKRSDFDWRLAIMDDIPAGVDPGSLGSGGCHPAWMRPPADIFVAAQRVATRCGNQRLTPADASKELAQALLHELGHAIEFEFMGRGFGRSQRWHSEGFARWFETLAGEYLSGHDNSKSRTEVRRLASKVMNAAWRPSMFRGSGEDYARSYALIAVIAEKRSISRLTDVYARMDKDGVGLTDAVERELGWSESQWVSEATKYIIK